MPTRAKGYHGSVIWRDWFEPDSETILYARTGYVVQNEWNCFRPSRPRVNGTVLKWKVYLWLGNLFLEISLGNQVSPSLPPLFHCPSHRLESIHFVSRRKNVDPGRILQPRSEISLRTMREYFIKEILMQKGSDVFFTLPYQRLLPSLNKHQRCNHIRQER